MSLVTSYLSGAKSACSGCLDRAKSVCSGVKNNLKENGKSYLIGIAMIVASAGLAYWIHSNLRPTQDTMFGGGRHLNVIGEMLEPNFRTVDFTPGFRKLAEMVGGGNQAVR